MTLIDLNDEATFRNLTWREIERYCDVPLVQVLVGKIIDDWENGTITEADLEDAESLIAELEEQISDLQDEILTLKRKLNER